MANNGGPTQTVALLAGSPAIGKGIIADYPGSNAPIFTDQRALPRHTTPDVGAYEHQNQQLVVTTAVDEDNGTADPAFGAGTSLREAINYANTLGAGTHAITFDPTLFATPQTITLSGTLGALELSDATGTTTITGPAAGVTVSGGNNVEVFSIDSGVTATLSGLTIANGKAADGGGILNNGTLVLSNDTLTGNAASNSGGAICNNSVLTVLDSTISKNTSANIAGGINGNNGSTLNVSGSTFSDNSVVGYGGGLLVTGGSVTVINSTFSGNSATLSGGAIEDTGSVTVLDSTFSGNSAGPTGGGGAIDNFDGGYTLKIGDSILAGNLSVNAPDVANSVTSLGNNLVGNTKGSSGWVASDLTGTAANPLDPLLAPLGNYGGPTQTFALLPGSPAIDAGSNAGIPSGVTTDQRGPGFARKSGPAVDIGAFEYQYPITTATNTKVISSHNPSTYGQLVTFTATVVASSTHKPVTSGSVTFADGTLILDKNVPLNASGVASFHISTLSATTVPDTITATYNAVAPYTGSVGALMQVVNRATPVFSNLSNLTILDHTNSTTLSGKLVAGSLIPPGSVSITVNGVTLSASIKSDGSFSLSFPTKSLAAGTYVVKYAYARQTNFNAAAGAGSLKVTYSFWLGENPPKVYKSGSTIPVSFTLRDANNQEVDFAARSATAIGIASAATPNTLLPLPSGSSPGGKFTPDGEFDYYTLSLKTTGLPPGTYLLYFTINNDPVRHSLTFIIGKLRGGWDWICP